MESEKKKRGRPTKNGVRDPAHLSRALKIICSYENARTGGIKHSSAVREAIAFVRQLDPGMPVSETEVKRILAELRPSDSPVSIQSNYEILEGEEAARIRSRFAHLLALAGCEAQSFAPDEDPTRPLKRFSISISKRRNYPRHNAKKLS
jgi:hypothetical protein